MTATKKPTSNTSRLSKLQNNLKAMSGNPFSQEPILSQEEFRLLEEVEYWLNFNLTRPEILAQAKFYAEYADGEISTALKVMLKGSDRDEVQNGDEVWEFRSVACKASPNPIDWGKGYYMKIHNIYCWGTYKKGTFEDPHADDEISDAKPSDYPEHYLSY